MYGIIFQYLVDFYGKMYVNIPFPWDLTSQGHRWRMGMCVRLLPQWQCDLRTHEAARSERTSVDGDAAVTKV